MTPKKIGERPAHPALEIDHGKVVHRQGMTIRQYYKAAALQGVLIEVGKSNASILSDIKHIADVSGIIADALLDEDAAQEGRE